MPSTLCTVCGEPAIDPTATLGQRCRNQLETALNDIAAPTAPPTSSPFDYQPTLVDDIQTLAAGQTAITATNTQPTRTDPDNDQLTGELPLERAGRLLHELHNELVGVARMLGVDDQVDPPGTSRQIAATLLNHHHRIAHHEAAADIHAGLTSVVNRCRAAIDRPADRMYVGRCYADPSCTADLWAIPDTDHVQCRTCGATYDLKALRAALLGEAADHLEIAETISRALTSIGEPVTPAMIRGYAHRRRLLDHGRDQHGRRLYRLGDVRALITLHRRPSESGAAMRHA